ncbi:hypothetical protein [Pannonibacter carbonis]|uniref:hypothetical protein n=1 Tax=Pannonibacter carbonis TaxID=2067569 RepID=UPI000D114887|nr:hypothetical protein [Pannonibacter carbonis]
MAAASKGVKRQAFGPNETDINLCYFVCWDVTATPEDGIANSWAHFTDREDAAEYFGLKSKDAKTFVWQGELGISKADGHFDWYSTNWSRNLDAQMPHKQAAGKGYRFTNDVFEEFDALEFEEEEAE